MTSHRTIDGRFDLGATIGQGGMATIHRALDRVTGEQVAVKLVRDATRPGVPQLTSEAAILASVRHPAVVRYVAHGITTCGQSYLAMEWLPGEDLRARLRRWPMTLRDSIAVGRRVAEALTAVHALGCVHSDVKPSNIFLAHRDVEAATLLDFGIAQRRGHPPSDGLIMGTPGYLAPELTRGDRAFDLAADVFSFGCVLYRCLTGRMAFTGDSLTSVLLRLLSDESPRVSALRPQVPPALDALVARMLRKEPAERPTMSEVAEILAELSWRGEAEPRGRAGQPFARTRLRSDGAAIEHVDTVVDHVRKSA